MLPLCVEQLILEFKQEMEELEKFKVLFFRVLIHKLFFVGNLDGWFRFPVDLRVWSLESSTPIGYLGNNMDGEIWKCKQNRAKSRHWYYFWRNYYLKQINADRGTSKEKQF